MFVFVNKKAMSEGGGGNCKEECDCDCEEECDCERSDLAANGVFLEKRNEKS